MTPLINCVAPILEAAFRSKPITQERSQVRLNVFVEGKERVVDKPDHFI